MKKTLLALTVLSGLTYSAVSFASTYVTDVPTAIAIDAYANATANDKLEEVGATNIKSWNHEGFVRSATADVLTTVAAIDIVKSGIEANPVTAAAQQATGSIFVGSVLAKLALALFVDYRLDNIADENG